MSRLIPFPPQLLLHQDRLRLLCGLWAYIFGAEWDASSQLTAMTCLWGTGLQAGVPEGEHAAANTSRALLVQGSRARDFALQLSHVVWALVTPVPSEDGSVSSECLSHPPSAWWLHLPHCVLPAGEGVKELVLG